MVTTYLIGTDINCTRTKYKDLAIALSDAWSRKEWVGLIQPKEQESWWSAIGSGNNQNWPSGPGIILGSGGSTGGRRWCLQPLTNLKASAEVTGQWLSTIGLNPSLIHNFNPLPLHHISGLMPLIRTIVWGGSSVQLPSKFMRMVTEEISFTRDSNVISLVPTQLDRLLATQSGVNWLKSFAVIWVGGAALLPLQAKHAREKGLRLAPCYGATETAAMVCAIPPDLFLNELTESLQPLPDVQLRLDKTSGAIEVSTNRLSPGWIEDGYFHYLQAPKGWWRSGDSGILTKAGLKIQGRLDCAINSGGETIFPEQLEVRIKKLAKSKNISILNILILAKSNPQWGENLIALVNCKSYEYSSIIYQLRLLVQEWPPAERPHQWIFCPKLFPSPEGKWNRKFWTNWVSSNIIEASKIA